MDPELDPDETRDIALERGFAEHDTLIFNGKAIRPVSAGSMAILQRIKNGLIFGDASNALYDAAGFLLIHTDAEDGFRAARRAAFGPDWSEYVINWLDATPDAHAKIQKFAPVIVRLLSDYGQSLTRSLESHESGNAGGHTG